MDTLNLNDVPYGDDWDDTAQAAAWAEAAERKRPWRVQIRDHIAEQIAKLAPHGSVLELGSGPGFLAHSILQRCPDLQQYVLLDFSEPMLSLSRTRLTAFPAATFVRASFKSPQWPQQVIGPLDVVVSMQAVHELRHKRYACGLYEQARRTMAKPGTIFICDHTPFDETPKSTALYMSQEEQLQALADAGFSAARVVLSISGLVLYQAERVVTERDG
jgi:cyclopropane fatty-acyl-phospholipid synthase-like methyltransferase